MQSVIIVAPRTCSLERFRDRLPSGCDTADAGPERFVIESDGRRAYLGLDHCVQDEFESEELAEVLRAVPDPTFYVLEFSDIELCKDILRAIADRPDVCVDNDHGVVLPGNDFIRILRSQPDWDWRDDSIKR